MFCFCVHITKQTVFVHKAVVFNVFNIWILFKIHQLYYRVFFYHEVKCLCLCFLVWLFCTVLLFNIISHIHFYMSTHLVCICFDFFFHFVMWWRRSFCYFYSDFLLLKNHFSFVMFLVTLFDTWLTLPPSLRAVSMTTHLQLDCHTILQKSNWVSLENGPVNR